MKSVVTEKAPPGEEDFILKSKKSFIKRYGKKKGLSYLYATAWKRHNKESVDSDKLPINEAVFSKWMDTVKKLFASGIPSHGLLGLMQEGLIKKEDVRHAYKLGLRPDAAFRFLMSHIKSLESFKTFAEEYQPGDTFVKVDNKLGAVSSTSEDGKLVHVKFVDGGEGWYHGDKVDPVHKSPKGKSKESYKHLKYGAMDENMNLTEAFEEGMLVKVVGNVVGKDIEGQITKVSPSGNFCWVQLRNGDLNAYHQSDIQAYDPSPDEEDEDGDYGFERWNDAETMTPPWDLEDDPRNPYNDSVQTEDYDDDEDEDEEYVYNADGKYVGPERGTHDAGGHASGEKMADRADYLSNFYKDESVNVESTGADCNIIEREPGKWYLSIQQYPYGDNPNYDEKGPFSSDNAALAYLNKKYANPGGYGVIPYRAKESVQKDFKAITESVVNHLDNLQPGFWYTFGKEGPIFEYRAHNKSRVISLPPKHLAGKLLEQREINGQWFIRMENQVPQEWLHKYGLIEAGLATESMNWMGLEAEKLISKHNIDLNLFKQWFYRKKQPNPHDQNHYSAIQLSEILKRIKDFNMFAFTIMSEDLYEGTLEDLLQAYLDDPSHVIRESQETLQQSAAVDRLAKAGFSVSKASEDDYGDYTVYMSKHYRFGMLLAQVDSNGLVNGENVFTFLKGVRKQRF